MKKITTLFLVSIFSLFISTAQNLVVNPSFEQTANGCTGFPIPFEGMIDLVDWDNVSNNTPADTCSTPDLFSTCNDVSLIPGFDFVTAVPGNALGYQCPRTGEKYAGFISYDATGSYREYLQGRLSSPLQAGQIYCVAMFVSLADAVPFASNNIGIHFANTHQTWNAPCFAPYTPVPLIPQLNYTCVFTDTTWVRLQWDYVAAGGEQYIIIGNFFNNGATTTTNTGQPALPNPFAYYYVDDVSVEAGSCCQVDIQIAGNTDCDSWLAGSGSGSDASFCVTDSPINLTATSAVNGSTCSPALVSGTWSGTGITNTSLGAFSPSTAGAGLHSVSFTSSAGCSDTVLINVSDCQPLNICYNGLDLVVSNGTGGYTWSTCSSVNSGSCVSWTAVETGTNYTTSSTSDIILVEDGMGVTDTLFNGITGVPTCSATCDATITSAGPFCQNATAVNLVAAQTGGTWSGTGITNTTNGTFNPATAGVGNHTITYTLGCGDVDTETIVVNALDNAGFSYSSGSYCLADADPIPTITGLAGGTFTINNSGVINASTGVVNITGSGVGSFTVTYTTNGTCPNSATFDIVITSTTDATITQADPFCVNAAAVNLTAVSSGGNWTGTGITNATLGTFNPATAGVGNHIITYTITGSCGSVDTMTIMVNAVDNAAFSYSTNTFCLTDANPTPIITGVMGGTFTINNSGVINDSTGVINLTSSGTGAFTVTYTTTGACPNSQTFNLTINSCTSPLPVANFSASQTSICIGDCVNFTDMSTSSAVGGITAWAWTFTGAVTTSSSVQNPTNICYSTAGTYQVVLTVTDANGSDTETKTTYITVSTCTPPTVGFTISDTVICAGSCISFTDASTGATSWQWTFENGNPPSSTAQNPTNICYSDSGIHEVKLLVSNAFGSDSTTQYVTVLQPQQVFVGNDTIIQLGQSVNINATGVVDGTYTWTPPLDLTCTTCPNPTATPEETITYTIIASDTNGCRTTDNITIIVEFNNVIFVPNIFSPNGDGANDILFVRGKGVAKLKFVVYDRWGEKVFETTSLDVGWDGSFRGKDMNKAVFVYYLEATFIDGKEVTQKGDITLVK